MKSTLRNYIFVFCISCLPLIGIFITSSLYHSHDGFVHLARIGAYVKALKDGEFPVRWAGDLNYGYGMPLFNFMYQVPYFIASLLVAIGFGLVNAFKITISLSYILSGIFMFAFAKEFFKDNAKALFITVFYQFSPFRLVELLVRGSFGEVYTYAFLPLVLFGLARFFHKRSFGNFFLTATAAALLILSHNALSLVFFGMCMGFALLFSKSQKVLIGSLTALVFGLGLSAFYWIPAIFEHKYTYGDLFMQNLYLQHFPPLVYFFLPNFTNDVHLQTKGISVQIGIFHVVTIIFAVLVIFAKKHSESVIKKILIASLIVFVLLLFFMQPVSKPVWAHVSLLRQFQFSWRLLGFVSFITSLLSISIFSFSFIKKKYIYWSILILVIITTAYYWRPPLGYDKISEAYFWNYPMTSTYFGETDVIWSEGPAKSYPKQRVEFIAGRGTIQQFSRKTNGQTFLVDAQLPSTLVDHIEYYPGWRVFVNTIPTTVQFQDPNWRGQITFSVPSGKNTVSVQFGEIYFRLITDLVSLVAIAVLIVMGIFREKLFYENKKI